MKKLQKHYFVLYFRKSDILVHCVLNSIGMEYILTVGDFG